MVGHMRGMNKWHDAQFIHLGVPVTKLKACSDLIPSMVPKSVLKLTQFELCNASCERSKHLLESISVPSGAFKQLGY